jgi:hypothetical protein
MVEKLVAATFHFDAMWGEHPRIVPLTPQRLVLINPQLG